MNSNQQDILNAAQPPAGYPAQPPVNYPAQPPVSYPASLSTGYPVPPSSGYQIPSHYVPEGYVPVVYYIPEEPKKYSTLFNLWRAAYPILIYFVVQFAVGVLLALVLVAALGSAGLVDEASLYDFIWQVFVALGVAELVCIPLLIAFRRSDIKRQKRLGEYREYERISFLKCLLCLLLGIATALLAITAFSLVGEDFSTQSEVFSSNPWLGILFIGILTPAAEELLFRVVVYGRLREWLSPISAGLICALVFALAHGNATQGVTAFFYGLLMCLVYEKWKSFWAPFLVHAGINSTVVIMALFPNAGSTLSFGVIPFLVLIVCLAMIALAVFAALKWMPSKEKETPTEVRAS